MQDFVLMLHILELRILLLRAGLEDIGQVINAIPKLFTHFLQVGLCGLFEFLELEMELRLLFLLFIQKTLELREIALGKEKAVPKVNRLVR